MLDKRRESVRTGTRIVVVVSEIDLLADDTERELPHTPTLADSGIEDRGVLARIGADDHDRVGIIDASNRRIEEIAGAAELGMQYAAILPRIDVLRTEPLHQ